MKKLAIAVIGTTVACVLIYATAYLYFHSLAYGRSDTCREMARWPLSTAPGTRTARHMGRRVTSGGKALDETLCSLEGNQVKLADLWNERPIVVEFGSVT